MTKTWYSDLPKYYQNQIKAMGLDEAGLARRRFMKGAAAAAGVAMLGAHSRQASAATQMTYMCWEGYNDPRIIDPFNKANDTEISFDLIVSATQTFNVGGWEDWNWYQLHFAGNSDGTQGWTQDPPSGANPVNTNYHPTDPDLTWHFDFSFAEMGWQPGDTWFQVFFGANSDSAKPVQFLIDNIRIYEVPEPGTFALAGLGAAVLLILRRRR